MSQAVQQVLEDGVARGAGIGFVAVAGDRDGQTVEAAAGTLTEGGAAVTPDTLFRLASLTKLATTTAVLQLVEQGRLTLDQRISTVCPEFGALQVLDGFDGDTPRLRPPATEATVIQLLTHTSGLGYFFTNPELAHHEQVSGIPGPLSQSFASLHHIPLVADPGTIWEYGTSTDWLGQVVEKLTGRSLADALQETVLGPLGMTSCTFTPTQEQRAGLMPIHARTPDGLVATDIDWPLESDFRAGGHGLYGTTGDYLRLTRAILRGGELDGERILEESSVELMLTSQIGDIEVPHEIPAGAPQFTNPIVMPSELPHSWGAGLHLTLADLPGMRRAGSGDWAGVFNSYYWIDPASGITGVIQTQLLPFFDAQVLEVAGGFEMAVYAAA